MKEMLLMEVPTTQIIKILEDNLLDFVREELYLKALYSEGRFCQYFRETSPILERVYTELVEQIFPGWDYRSRWGEEFSYPEKWPQLIDVNLQIIRNFTQINPNPSREKRKEFDDSPLQFQDGKLQTHYGGIVSIKKEGFIPEEYLIEIFFTGYATLENNYLRFKIATENNIGIDMAVQDKSKGISCIQLNRIHKKETILNYFLESFNMSHYWVANPFGILYWEKLTISAQYQQIDLIPLLNKAYKKARKKNDDELVKAASKLTKAKENERKDAKQVLHFWDHALPKFIECLSKELKEKKPIEVDPQKVFEENRKAIDFDKYRWLEYTSDD